MSQSRFVYHPVLGNKKSVFIFFSYFSMALILGGLFWWKLDSALMNADVFLSDGRIQLNTLQKMLLSVHFRVVVIMVAALIGTALTAHHVVGPIRRLEQWMKDWEMGKNIPDLKVRSSDKFEYFVQLINELHRKIPK